MLKHASHNVSKNKTKLEHSWQFLLKALFGKSNLTLDLLLSELIKNFLPEAIIANDINQGALVIEYNALCLYTHRDSL